MVTKLDNIAEDVVQLLNGKKLKLSTAESCTGGLISSEITAVPGSSEVFGFGFVTYANEAKNKLIGVPTQTLSSYGAVSEQTARAMALGAKEVSGADIAVAVTGIAGPSGGTPEKPVGTVYIGLATKTHVTVKRCLFDGGLFKDAKDKREAIRCETAYTALSIVKDELELIERG